MYVNIKYIDKDTKVLYNVYMHSILYFGGISLCLNELSMCNTSPWDEKGYQWHWFSPSFSLPLPPHCVGPAQQQMWPLWPAYLFCLMPEHRLPQTDRDDIMMNMMVSTNWHQTINTYAVYPLWLWGKVSYIFHDFPPSESWKANTADVFDHLHLCVSIKYLSTNTLYGETLEHMTMWNYARDGHIIISKLFKIHMINTFLI